MHKGEVFVKNKRVGGKILKAVIDSSDPEAEYLVAVSTWVEGDSENSKKTFLSAWQLKNHWKSLERGIQLKFIK